MTADLERFLRAQQRPPPEAVRDVLRWWKILPRPEPTSGCACRGFGGLGLGVFGSPLSGW